MQEIKTNEKIQYFNIIKSISIFLVVFCHIVILNFNGIIDNICMLICWIAVPCFFLVNGAILLNKKLDLQKHYKKVLIIYIVNIIWRIVYLIIYIAIFKFDISSVSKLDLTKYIFLFKTLPAINTDHFYFIKALLAIYIILPVIHCCFNEKNNGKKYMLIISIVIFCFTYGINIVNFIGKFIIKDNRISLTELQDIFLFGKYAAFLLFFILGGFIHYYKEKIQKIKYIKTTCIFCIVISLGMLMLSKYIMNGTFRWKGIYLQNGYDKIGTFIMSIAIFILIQNVKVNNNVFSKIVDKIGTNTLGIYYIHMPLLVIFSTYLYKYIAFKGVVANLLKSIIVIVISFAITKILKKIPGLRKIVI